MTDREARAAAADLLQEGGRKLRLYEAIISSTPDLVYVFDLEYRFIFVNDALLRMWGRTLEESIGKRLTEVGYEEWHARMHEREIDQVVATRQPVRGDVPFEHATLGRRIYDYLFVPVIGEDGEVEAVAGTTRDVTERRQAEEHLRKREESLSSDLADMERLHALSARLLQQGSLDAVLREVLEAATELMDTRFGSTHLFDSANGALELVSSVGFDGRFDELFPSVGEDSAASCSLAVSSRERVTIEDLDSAPEWRQMAEALQPYGIRSVQSTPILGSDGRVLGVLSTHFDRPQRPSERQLRLLDLYTQLAARQIEHEWAEQEVRELNASLEQRVRERTEALRAANQELEAFNYSVSHDLRAPLRSVDGFSRVLLEEHRAGLDPEAQHLLERINAGAQRMGLLIDALLQLSRLTRSELIVEEVDLSELAHEIACSLREKQPQRRVCFEIEPELKVAGDRQLLTVALGGLLENAWKFTAGKENATIRVGVEGSGEERAYFVEDDGAGFDMRYEEKLFAPFQRLHAASEFEGTGIGLATVQRIVHRHRGKIWARGEVNEGATFYFTLPAN